MQPPDSSHDWLSKLDELTHLPQRTVNEAILAQKSPGSAPEQLILAKNGLNTKPPGQQFVAVEQQRVVRGRSSVKATALTQLDGQYVLLLGGNVLGSSSNNDDDRRRYRPRRLQT